MYCVVLLVLWDSILTVIEVLPLSPRDGVLQARSLGDSQAMRTQRPIRNLEWTSEEHLAIPTPHTTSWHLPFPFYRGLVGAPGTPPGPEADEEQQTQQQTYFQEDCRHGAAVPRDSLPVPMVPFSSSLTPSPSREFLYLTRFSYAQNVLWSIKDKNKSKKKKEKEQHTIMKREATGWIVDREVVKVPKA